MWFIYASRVWRTFFTNRVHRTPSWCRVEWDRAQEWRACPIRRSQVSPAAPVSFQSHSGTSDQYLGRLHAIKYRISKHYVIPSQQFSLLHFSHGASLPNYVRAFHHDWSHQIKVTPARTGVSITRWVVNGQSTIDCHHMKWYRTMCVEQRLLVAKVCFTTNQAQWDTSYTL